MHLRELRLRMLSFQLITHLGEKPNSFMLLSIRKRYDETPIREEREEHLLHLLMLKRSRMMLFRRPNTFRWVISYWQERR